MKEKIKNIESEALFKCDVVICSNDWVKMYKYFPIIYWKYVFFGTFLTLIVGLGASIKTNNIFNIITSMSLCQILMMLGTKLYLNNIIEKSFYKNSKGKTVEVSYEFYDEFLLIIYDTSLQIIKYDELNKCIENNTNFYLCSGSQIILLKKDEMKLELIEFIRKKISNISNCT